jgi:serine/threonine protein kinase
LVEDLGYDRRKCLLKEIVLSESNSKNLAIRGKFKRERDLLSYELSGNYVPKLSDHFEQDNRLYLVCPFINGQILSEEIPYKKEIKPWDESKVLTLLRELVNVLIDVQEPKIVHCRIEPDNLIKKPDNTMVLINWGDAKKIDPAAATLPPKTETINGKREYEAPERNLYRLFAVDVYSIGTICVHALTGKPFSEIERYTNNHEIKLPENNEQDSDLARILVKMTHLNPGDRYQSAKAVLQDLNKMSV